MNENEVRDFWNAHPCGEELVGGVTDDFEEFYARYDKFRYSREGHILKSLDAIDFKGKRVLEVGLGLGADSEQIIRRGASWNGVDLTPESIARLTTRFKLRNLPYEHLKVGSVCELPFDNDTFDVVYSFGVLHHVPDIEKAQSEIARVLKPGGKLIVMLYAKYSLNYLVSISIVRRVALFLLYVLGITPKGMAGQHLTNLREMGVLKYLRMQNFIHRNTDGPLNPYSKVYDLAEVRKDFKKFRVIKSYKEFMHAPPLPVAWLPLSHQMGWHLWVHMVPIKVAP